MLERVVVKRSFTLTKTFYSSGVPTEPNTAPTVTVVRDDGTTVTTGAVTDEAGVGVWSVTVAASQNTRLDILTVTWTATVNTEPQTHVDTVEVAGDVLFTLADARALNPLSDTTVYTAAEITAARTDAETFLERWCGALARRYARKTVVVRTRGTDMLLPPETTVVRSATLAGVALTATELAALEYDPVGLVYNPAGWAAGRWTVGYEYGPAYVDPAARRAALLLARHYLVDSPIDDRFTSVSSEAGTFTMVTPGMRGAYTALPEVNAFIEDRRQMVFA